MNSISACIITDNNPNVIKAIESVYDSVSEIILVNTVDSLSKDITDFIFPDAKYKLFNFKWNDSFSDAFNYAISKATQDWTFLIHSDEILNSPIVREPDKQFTHYLMPILNGEYISHSIRLWQTSDNVRFVNMVHETIEHCFDKENGCNLNSPMLIHSGLYDEISNYKKTIRNLELLLGRDKDNTLVNYRLCDCYYFLGNFEKAIYYGELAIESNYGDGYKAIVYTRLYDAYEKLGKIRLDYLNESIKLMPNQIYSRYKLIPFLNEEDEWYLMLNELEEILYIVKNKCSEMPNDIYPDEQIIFNKIKEIKCHDNQNISELKAVM